jgi:LEA14-like dessication related protein
MLASPVDPKHAPWTPKFPKIINYALRAIDGLKTEVWMNDVHVCEEANPNVKIHILAPKFNYIDALDFENMHEKIKLSIAQGENVVRKYLDA